MPQNNTPACASSRVTALCGNISNSDAVIDLSESPIEVNPSSLVSTMYSSPLLPIAHPDDKDRMPLSGWPVWLTRLNLSPVSCG